MAPKDLDPLHRLQRLQTGEVLSIWATDEVARAIEALEPGRRGRLKRIMRILCDNGPDDLPKSQLADEGRWPTGGLQTRHIQITALKVEEFRMYGHRMHVARGKISERCFISMVYDNAKKQRKADQSLLRKAAVSMRPFYEASPEAK
jgi:hypothetical protein